MDKSKLRDQYLEAMKTYTEEVSKTKILAFQSDPAAFSAQLKREKVAEEAYHEAQREFVEAVWEPDRRK